MTARLSGVCFLLCCMFRVPLNPPAPIPVGLLGTQHKRPRRRSATERHARNKREQHKKQDAHSCAGMSEPYQLIWNRRLTAKPDKKTRIIAIKV